MDLATIRTFLAAATVGSFAKAAARVNASPSAVTERMKSLEHELGVRLFDRDKRGCRLTAAGRRFLIPAQNLLRSWQQACEQATMPPRYRQTVRIGGQHALWPTLLIPWLHSLGSAFPDIAFSAMAAAPQQLNRALYDAEMDIAFLYEPVLQTGFRIEQLAPDRLILVTASPAMPWQGNFTRIKWGDHATAELRARIGELPAAGLELDLGILALEWLVETGASGYVPEGLAAPFLRAGQLHPVANMPTLEFSPFVCWRESLDDGLIGAMLGLVKQQMIRNCA